MATKKFPRGDLLLLIGREYRNVEGSSEGYELIDDEIWTNTRWAIVHKIIFKHGGQFWTTMYQVGATEFQEQEPWEFLSEVECTEVVPVEKTITTYEVKK